MVVGQAYRPGSNLLIFPYTPLLMPRHLEDFYLHDFANPRGQAVTDIPLKRPRLKTSTLQNPPLKRTFLKISPHRTSPLLSPP